MKKWHSEGGLTTDRIEILADGVFAIVMTLLIFNIKVPDIAPGLASSELPSKVFELWPKFITYMISFAVTGIYWIGHPKPV